MIILRIGKKSLLWCWDWSSISSKLIEGFATNWIFKNVFESKRQSILSLWYFMLKIQLCYDINCNYLYDQRFLVAGNCDRGKRTEAVVYGWLQRHFTANWRERSFQHVGESTKCLQLRQQSSSTGEDGVLPTEKTNMLFVFCSRQLAIVMYLLCSLR